jgi:quercetin dioxygenase-like cupin family protein
MKYEERAAFEQADAFGIGAPNDAYAQYFVGDSFLHPLTDPKECPVYMANVTFEPGCRNNWHIHHADKGGGQILVCTVGEGVYQEWGKEPQILHPGDVVYIKPGVKHYHGAAADSWFSHIAVECPGENCSNEWCEPVTDEQYNSAKIERF